MLSQRQVDALYREHADYVRFFLQRYSRRIQLADVKDIEQTVWENVVSGWNADPRESDRAYLTGIIKNAVPEFYRRKHAQKRDERLTQGLVEEGASGPIDLHLIAPDEDAAISLDIVRATKRLRVIARRLPARELAIYERFIAEPESVPAKDTRRLVAALKEIMNISARPRSVEHPDEVEGPSHCGRTLRRLGLHTDEGDATGEDEMLDAAE
jgi:DNA-directed RNA polymerase specialized sigma24 family protein